MLSYLDNASGGGSSSRVGVAGDAIYRGSSDAFSLGDGRHILAATDVLLDAVLLGIR